MSLSTRPSRRLTRKKPVVEDSDEEEEEQLQDAPVTPQPTKRAPRAKATGRKKAISDGEDEVQNEEYTPQPAQKRGRGRPSRASVAAATATPKRPGRRPKAAVTVAREEDQQEVPVKIEATEDDNESASESVLQSSKSIRTQLNQPVTPPESPAPQPASAQSQNPPSTPLAEITNNLGATYLTTPKSEKNMGDAEVTPRQRQMLTPPEEPAGPKPRIVITHLVMMNFKSYAGRQEVGPFHSSFTSVVGPNGSGKSNVIDSLLFVFGFRASKMRQGKLSALIHNSAGYPNLDFCEVEVHFQEVIDMPHGTEIVPNSVLVIARRAFKNNSSNYYINGKTSSYTIVTTLLRERGVDLDHKRFLILQGEVESIAQMKPKAQTEHDDGLLEYLEDIIGTSNYKAPIEESAAEVETLNEVCLEKSNRVAIVEKEKNGLEGQKIAAVTYIQNENELAMKQATLYQVFISECEQNIEITSDSINQLQIQLNEELEKHQGNEDGMKKLEKRYKQGLKEYDNLEKQTQNIVKESAKYEKDNVKFQEKKKFLVTKQKRLEKTANSSRLAASEAKSLIERFTDDVTRTGGQVTDLEGRLQIEEKELQKIRDELKDKTQGLSDEIALKQKSLEPWNAKINEKESTIAVTRSELDILHEKSNASKRAFEEVQAKIASIQEHGRAKEAELSECQAEQVNLKKEAQKLQAHYDKMVQKEPELASSLSTSRQRADEAKSSLSATQNQGNVLNGLMRLKDSGRIEGFHGRLGNLGTIDAKFDVAISTACPSLGNIVVDSVEVGQQCIDHLRKNNLGRAKFILLDRLPKRDMEALQTPENVPRLFDLVKPKSEIFRSAFYSVLQDTLVASDLAQANRIAYGAKRWRVVTLDGQLIDKSGTMSGGGNKPASGGMSSKLAADTTPAVVAKLEADRDAQEQTYRQFQEQQRDLEDKLKLVKDGIPELDVRMSKIQLEISSAARNLIDSQKRVDELSSEARPATSDGGEVKLLEKKIAGLESEIAKLKKETAGVENEIKALQDKIMEIGGIRLRSQKSTVDGIREKMETLVEEMTNAEVNRSKAEKTKQKSEKSEISTQKELEDATNELEALEEELASHAASAEETIKRAEEAREFLEQRKEELEVAKGELDEKMTELNQTRAVEIEIKNTLEEHQKAFTENQKRFKYWQEKMSKLTLQNLSDLGEEEAEGHELPTYSKDELADMDKDDLKGEIAALEEKLQNVNVELGVLKEYRRRVEEHNARSQDLATSVSTRDAAKKRCDDLRKRRLDEFMEGFSIISLRLKEMYQMITMGGNAELELVDSLDPFAEGILFSVMPPKKSWKNISNLSGGEKTLSSLALVFALHHYKPTPLYVMDEIDAALDFRNVSIVASYIKERTKNAQFIVISLRNNMFELAARLVGVYKVNQMTKSVTIENQDFLVRS